MSSRVALDRELGTRWLERLLDLARRMRTAARDALLDAIAKNKLDELMRPHSLGAGDITYGIDVPTEHVLDAWLDDVSREEPLSLLTEDSGWRHRAPSAQGPKTLTTFDHTGPRIVVDPIDGTRNLMTDVRSAWSVIALCGPGSGEPRMSDVSVGVLAEIPDSRGAKARTLFAVRGMGAKHCEEELAPGAKKPLVHKLKSDDEGRADHGYFPFFRYMADLRPEIATIEAAFFDRLEALEGADVRTCYDDQYISNGGQLALLALGKYRMIADLRAFLATRRGRATLTCKPYDCAGAILVAREAGCSITNAVGGELDFPLDVHTPVSFVGWHNALTRMRLEPHLRSVLGR